MARIFMAMHEKRAEAFIAVAGAALADLRARPHDVGARRRLSRNLGRAIAAADRASRAGVALSQETRQALADLFGAVRLEGYRLLR